MIKRILMIWLTFLLLCGVSACAEEAYARIDNAMYRIVLRTETEDVTLGSGVLFREQNLLLTAQGCCAEGDLYAIGNDGEHAITAWSAVESTGVVLMEMVPPSAAEPMPVNTGDVQGLPFVFGADAQGRIGSMPLYLARYGLHHGHDALVLSSEEGLLPGAFMADAKGQLIALVITQHMEGMGSYLAMDAIAVESALAENEKDRSPFLDTTITWEYEMMKVAWQDATRPSGEYIITVSGGENVYYTTYVADRTERSLYLAVPPGHTYYVQVQWATNEASSLPIDWSAVKPFTVPETAFNDHSFTNECYLASAPAGQIINSTLPEMLLISVDTLEDPRADMYLQINNTYDVSAQIEVPMSVELIAPDGQFYFEEMGYTFSPDYEQDDSFAVPLDDMIATCAEFSGGALQPGSYLLRYALGGRIAGEYGFTLQPAGTTKTAPASIEEKSQTSGFASGVTAVNESGLITLSWDAASIPEGAKVNAYYIYEGNTYTTYHQMLEGASSTQLFAVPGRRVVAWVVWSTEGDPIPAMPQNERDMVIIPAAPETPLTAHSFRNLRIGVAPSADPDAGTRTEFLPEVPLTREILSDRDTPIYFQTEDTYLVSGTSEDHPMAIVLCTPEGLVFVDVGYYIFDLTLQGSDLWLKDISKLFADYESLVRTQAWPAGEYRILYCIDEQVAGEFTFTLE